LRDTLRASGWRLTDPHWGEGIFGDSVLGNCPGSTNYIYGEYGVVEQKISHKGRWSYTTFTTLDSTVREQWKYRAAGDKWIEWRTEYSASGQMMLKIRVANKPVGWSSKQVIWTFRDNGRCKCRRNVWRTRV
jgi:hypothetical protein